MAKQRHVLTVGLIGESSNDTNALVALLNQRYAGRFAAYQLVKKQDGDRLKSSKTKRLLAAAYAEQRPKLVIYIRDLDALESNATKWRERQAEFEDIKGVVGQEALFLLHIYQFEALLLADIATFNQQYKVAFPVKGDPMMVEKPKNKLKSATDKSKAARQYHENHSAELATKLDYAKLLTNCRYFREFDQEFADRLSK